MKLGQCRGIHYVRPGSNHMSVYLSVHLYAYTERPHTGLTTYYVRIHITYIPSENVIIILKPYNSVSVKNLVLSSKAHEHNMSDGKMDSWQVIPKCQCTYTVDTNATTPTVMVIMVMRGSPMYNILVFILYPPPKPPPLAWTTKCKT